MPIVYSKERAPRPFIDLLELWLDNVENYGNSILIIVPDDALMSVSCIRGDHSILLAGKLGWVIRVNEPVDLLVFHLHVLLLLLDSHDETSVSDQLVLRF